ncbi:MAG: hypothetical protein A2Y38_14485 [Spirochaetes bacterium GWB1_59_5]|nr:MAG: hypothetical protein A2Y38_14485 [Spirochaetes bacterium GWB1_59_5]
MRYDEVRKALRAAGLAKKISNGCLIAWQKSAEYLRYRAAREKLDNEEIRTVALALNDGKGPRDYADVAVFEVVRELAGRMQTGEITELADLAQVTKALAPLLRARIAADAEATRGQEKALQAQIDAINAEMDHALEECRQQLAAKDAEIATLKAALAAAGITDSAATPKDEFSPAEVARVKKIYGIK